MLWESGGCREFQKQVGCFPQVFLKDSCMDYDLFLCRECIQLSSKLVQIAVDDGCAFSCRTLEQRMLNKMGYAVVVALFVPCAASDA